MSGSKARKIWRRTIVGFSLAGCVALFLWASATDGGERIVLYAGGLFALGGLFEVHATGRVGARALALGVLPAGVAAWVFLYRALAAGDAYWSTVLESTLVALVLSPLAFLARPAYLRRAGGEPSLGWAPFALALWVPLPLCLAAVVRAHWGISVLIALIVLSKIGDIAGYYVGNAIGKSHPFPRISPGKTTAGCVGSLVTGSVAGVVCQWIGLFPDPRIGLASGLLAGGLLNVASQAGDLLESAVKRAAGVKDSGTLFGPSGGVLDVVDSLLLSVPAAILLLPALFAWPV